jgi:hypothetical protein
MAFENLWRREIVGTVTDIKFLVLFRKLALKPEKITHTKTPCCHSLASPHPGSSSTQERVFSLPQGVGLFPAVLPLLLQLCTSFIRTSLTPSGGPALGCLGRTSFT